MRSSGAGKVSSRSVRIRWNEKTNNDLVPDTVDRLKHLVCRLSSLQDQDKILFSAANYHMEWYMTFTFPDELIARRICNELDKLGDDNHVFDNSFDELTILHAPQDSDVDICAVHGLEGNAADTFTGKSKLWLRDLLPHQLPFDTARIMTFGYNSRLWDSKTTAGMADWADTLLRAVGQVRVDKMHRDRPIVFVCHSMGGLVVRRAIERLHQFAAMPHRFPGIKLGDCAILFISTPHLGTKSADYGNMFSQCLSTLTGLRKDAILKELQSFNSSAGDAIDDWEVMADSNTRPPFECLCESRKTKIGIREVELVTPLSASFLDHKAVQIPDADHVQVCKFDNVYRLGYKDVVAKLALLRARLLDRENTFGRVTSNSQNFQLPGEVPATPYRSPPPRGENWYLGTALKKRTGHFRGRQEILAAMVQAVDLQEGSENRSDNIIALSGIGGIGKTEILLEYGLSVSPNNNVFLCQAMPGETFHAMIYRLASVIGSEVLNPHHKLADREKVWNGYSEHQRVDAVLKWLQSTSVGASVVLLDDVDAFQSVSDVTSLSTALRAWPHPVLLSTRDPTLGDKLSRASYRRSESYTVGSLSEGALIPVMRQFICNNVQISQNELGAILRVVDGHAMAACRAVQFICEELALVSVSSPIDQFLESFDDSSTNYETREDFMSFHTPFERSLTACFEASFQRLGESGRLAVRILNFAVYLNAPNLDFRLFFQRRRSWLDAVPPGQYLLTKELLEMNDRDFAKALRQLVATSALMDVQGSLRVHSMMQEYIYHRQQEGGRFHIMRQIILLAKASILLDDEKELFSSFVRNCEMIARRFRIDPKDLEPPSSVMESIKRPNDIQNLAPVESTDIQRGDQHPKVLESTRSKVGMTLDMYTRMRTLLDIKQKGTETLFLNKEEHDKYYHQAQNLSFDFGQLMRSCPNVAGIPILDRAQASFLENLIEVVSIVNPVFCKKLQDLRAKISQNSDSSGQHGYSSSAESSHR